MKPSSTIPGSSQGGVALNLVRLGRTLLLEVLARAWFTTSRVFNEVFRDATSLLALRHNRDVVGSGMAAVWSGKADEYSTTWGHKRKCIRRAKLPSSFSTSFQPETDILLNRYRSTAPSPAQALYYLLQNPRTEARSNSNYPAKQFATFYCSLSLQYRSVVVILLDKMAEELVFVQYSPEDAENMDIDDDFEMEVDDPYVQYSSSSRPGTANSRSNRFSWSSGASVSEWAASAQEPGEEQLQPYEAIIDLSVAIDLETEPEDPIPLPANPAGIEQVQGVNAEPGNPPLNLDAIQTDIRHDEGFEGSPVPLTPSDEGTDRGKSDAASHSTDDSGQLFGYDVPPSEQSNPLIQLQAREMGFYRWLFQTILLNREHVGLPIPSIEDWETQLSAIFIRVPDTPQEPVSFKDDTTQGLGWGMGEKMVRFRLYGLTQDGKRDMSNVIGNYLLLLLEAGSDSEDTTAITKQRDRLNHLIHMEVSAATMIKAFAEKRKKENLRKVVPKILGFEYSYERDPSAPAHAFESLVLLHNTGWILMELDTKDRTITAQQYLDKQIRTKLDSYKFQQTGKHVVDAARPEEQAIIPRSIAAMLQVSLNPSFEDYSKVKPGADDKAQVEDFTDATRGRYKYAKTLSDDISKIKKLTKQIAEVEKELYELGESMPKSSEAAARGNRYFKIRAPTHDFSNSEYQPEYNWKRYSYGFRSGPCGKDKDGNPNYGTDILTGLHIVEDETLAIRNAGLTYCAPYEEIVHTASADSDTGTDREYMKEEEIINRAQTEQILHHTRFGLYNTFFSRSKEPKLVGIALWRYTYFLPMDYVRDRHMWPNTYEGNRIIQYIDRKRIGFHEREEGIAGSFYIHALRNSSTGSGSVLLHPDHTDRSYINKPHSALFDTYNHGLQPSDYIQPEIEHHDNL
ncbi:hypothetical protein BJ508DRAFT_379983 [Ascobolus immersus RN42]|uniref:Uncharacterized protein n=1 Tax=Ascobolus immersus RN42 TaxID=1160509 RepID=A0A3N4HSV3_ASCIM|nr:hypothetical protein BJ508DRAFT_379983 [Ascobolus immersus RN42]